MLPTRRPFKLVSPFKPMGDQPQALEALVRRIDAGERASVLLGATGTGKTFTMANVIERTQKPTLILSHNKTLAAQLYEEMKELFPNNAVSYFVSYYDYYQPEAYIPARDIYIEKDSSRNDDLDKLRLAATSNILSRRDTIVVASVSCIFGLGSPEAYGAKVMTLYKGMQIDRRRLFLALDAMLYGRADIEFQRGMFRARGDVVDIFPAYEQYAVRVELGGGFNDTVNSITLINPTSGEVIAQEERVFVFPAKHYVMPEDRMQAALSGIREEMDKRVAQLRHEGKLLEAQRLLARTKYDLEMLEETGVCQGVENYSRHLDGRAPGSKPWTLMDYFDYAPQPAAAEERTGTYEDRQLYRLQRRAEHDWLLIIDESHVTIPQVRAMYNGDQARKTVLVEHGFRLPSALDNRPLKFEEFEQVVPQVVYVSATPAPYELEKTGGEVAEQVIRPTGLLDPVIELKPAQGQVPDLIAQCKAAVGRGGRVLVTALTKRLCEDLTLYLHEQKLSVRYLHSEIETLERLEILTGLRRGEFDVLVGVNLLREGLDLPEVNLVCIVDADKEGFLRSPTSLIQTIGRAARNAQSKVVMYADKVTPAMKSAIDETERRRAKQTAYNAQHGTTPTTIIKAIRDGMETELRAGRAARDAVRQSEPEYEVGELVRMLEEEMLEAASQMEFEKAARLRDQAALLKSGKVKASGLTTGKGGAAKVRRGDVEGAPKTTGGGGSSPERKAGMPGVRANKKSRKKGKNLGGKPF
ncbi:MAG: excinuclease ABC subunit UvrB [Phycisphaerales bacterium]|nr:excinuclease ABC subunit UvrB [Phycisphaerales bacterium]